MKINTKALDYRTDTRVQLAGGYGVHAAKQDPLAQLRRLVLANLLWEDVAYTKGSRLAKSVATLVPQVAPAQVAALAVDVRTQQKLRHMPLLLAREMARHASHRHAVGALLPQIIRRADELTEFVAMYWKEGKQPLAKQVKVGLAAALARFNAYELAKYNRDTTVKLRDVLFLTHAKPTPEREDLYRHLASNTLPVPDTWEVALSRGADKKATWERLLTEQKLGGLALLRNLRNMEAAGVTSTVIAAALARLETGRLLPLNYLAAALAVPRWQGEIEEVMLRSLAHLPTLAGYTVLIVDVSGSMHTLLSSKSDFSRLDAACALAMLARECCERITMYATAGNDGTRIHATALVRPHRGFALREVIGHTVDRLGRGGIFTRQCLEYIATQEREQPTRIVVVTDSQDCDVPMNGLPRPFGERNYILDVSAQEHGMNYDGVWTAEISGWSEQFLRFIVAVEAPTTTVTTSATTATLTSTTVPCSPQ